MATNKKVEDYCRVSALHAMAYAFVEGISSREEVISFFGTLFTGDETDEDSDFWSLLACIVHDLYPQELMDTITRAYDDGLIFSGIVRYEDFEKALEEGKEKCLALLKTDLERRSLDDIHGSMSWWACFKGESQSYSAPESFVDDTFHPNTDQLSHRTKKKKQKAKKKKRKQAKASKRKNRR
jgi:hypothetical protein